ALHGALPIDRRRRRPDPRAPDRVLRRGLRGRLDHRQAGPRQQQVTVDPQSPPPPGETPGPGAEAPPPGFAEALRGLRESGLAGLGAAGDAAGAMRRLVAADMARDRSSAGRVAGFAGAAVIFGGSAWRLLMTALIVVLSRRLGLRWWLSLCGTGLLSGVAAWLMMRQATRCFEHTRFSATR